MRERAARRQRRGGTPPAKAGTPSPERTHVHTLRTIAACACLLLGTLALPSPPARAGESATVRVVDRDIERFWQAYDALRATDDPDRRRDLFQRLYVEPGTSGLTAFMASRNTPLDAYLQAIDDYPRFWDSVRPRTALARDALNRVEDHLARFRALYPDLRPATIYFVVGALRSVGTADGDKVLIGVELATADTTVVTDEMPQPMRQSFETYFATDPLQHLDLLAIHEFVHAQTTGGSQTLLAQALYEGVAEFVAEQVTGRLPDLEAMRYGPANEDEVRAAFQADMDDERYGGWLYAGPHERFGVGDLGYYVGYAICRSYYERAADRALAIRRMLELDFADQAAVDAFVDASGYFDP